MLFCCFFCYKDTYLLSNVNELTLDEKTLDEKTWYLQNHICTYIQILYYIHLILSIQYKTIYIQCMVYKNIYVYQVVYGYAPYDIMLGIYSYWSISWVWNKFSISCYVLKYISQCHRRMEVGNKIACLTET